MGEGVAVDVLETLSTSTRGSKYLLTVGDYFSKWVKAYPLKNQQTTVMAEVLVSKCIPSFESAVSTEVCKLLAIKKKRATALHPQSDDVVEIFKRTLENHLATFVERHQKTWDHHALLLLMSYRSTVHGSTRQIPANLMFGRELNLPFDLLSGKPPDTQPIDVDKYVANLQRRIENTHKFGVCKENQMCINKVC